MTQDDLEPLAPWDALDWYLEHRRDSLRTATRRKHRSALGTFVDWTDEAGIDDMNDVGGRQLRGVQDLAKDRDGPRRRQPEWEPRDPPAVPPLLREDRRGGRRLADRVPLPNVPPEEEVNYQVPTDDEVEGIRSYFRQFEYASRRHVEFELIAEVGIRLGGVRAIDLGDFDVDEKVIRLRHRPEGTDDIGTPLKNGPDGERLVNVCDQLREFIVDYLDHNRAEVTDKFGREPMFTTSGGRPSTATIRRDFYKMTRPCVYSNDCPDDRDVADCEAAKNANAADCPSRFSTHPLRKWAIMNQLDAGVPKELLSDRVDVSVPVLDKHYDQRTEEQKSRRRREELENRLEGYASD